MFAKLALFAVLQNLPRLFHPMVEADSRGECQANQILVKRTGVLSKVKGDVAR